MEKTRNEYKILVVKPEAKRPLGRQRHRRDNNMSSSILMQKSTMVLNLVQPKAWNFLTS
jgi:hypothetical protein